MTGLELLAGLAGLAIAVGVVLVGLINPDRTHGRHHR